MAEKFYKNEKFQNIFYAILYFLMIVAFAISGMTIFQKNYYTNIYVSGSSMRPTLIGDVSERVHYGISDNHDRAKDNLKRFDVVITYYPWNIPEGSTDEVFKIKRVWGFPGETISMQYSLALSSFIFTVSENGTQKYRITAPVMKKLVDNNVWDVAQFSVNKKIFYTHVGEGGENREFEITLSREKKEYFLMGDNWGHSTDSYSHIHASTRITYGDIQGRVVAIQGTARVKGDVLYDKKRVNSMYYF